jgi:hypothetical protein
METDRQRKRDSARKKSEFSVYSQKAVRAKEMCLAKAKGDPKETKPTKK